MKEKIVYYILPLLTLVYLITNFYMYERNIILCETGGCSLTKDFLKIETSTLYTLAIMIYILIISCSLINFNMLFKFFLLNVFVAETIILFIFYKETNEICLICLGFYFLVSINLILMFFLNKKENFSIIFLTISLIVNFVILEILILPRKNNNNIIPIETKYTILGTDTCKYCNDLKRKMKDLKIEYDYRNYKDFNNTLKLLDIKNIPVLLVKEDNNNFRLIYGESDINKEISKNINIKIDGEATIQKEKEEPKVENFVKSELMNQFLTDDGCSIVKNEEDCDDKEIK